MISMTPRCQRLWATRRLTADDHAEAPDGQVRPSALAGTTRMIRSGLSLVAIPGCDGRRGPAPEDNLKMHFMTKQ